MIRVVLPQHLRTLAGVEGEVAVEVHEPPTQRAVLDALETEYPVLRGTIRDHGTAKRRDFIRFFACGQDITLEPADSTSLTTRNGFRDRRIRPLCHPSRRCEAEKEGFEPSMEVSTPITP